MEGLAIGTINLLVLPTLGGYWFLYKFAGTHYRAERLTPQRLVFHAAMVALALFGIARLLVDLADSHWQPDDFLVVLLMFGVIPACVGFVLVSLFMMSWVAYGLVPADFLSTSQASTPPRSGDPSHRSFAMELPRAVAGLAVAALLMWLGVHIAIAIGTTAPMAAEFFSIVLFILLFGATALHHRFINKYFEFPFCSIALRIGLFGVIGSLTFSCFLFNFPFLHMHWNQLVHIRGSGIPVLAFTLGLVLWWPLNLLYPYQAANTRLHEANGTNALDRLLYQASLAQHLLCISMRDGKVYIGYIQELPPNPEDRNSYFEILPVHSGYRDKDTREMKLTTFYEGVYENLVQAGADENEWLVFLKVLKIDDILSAGRFDPEMYVKFNDAEVQDSAPEATDSTRG